MDKTAIRNAATVIVTRRTDTGPEVLMGQRGAGAAFMPNKFVFPGGAVDADDGTVPLAAPLALSCRERLLAYPGVVPLPALADALAVAAIRELWEETGLQIGQPGAWPGTPGEDWISFAETGLRPAADQLRFVFRAITPAGRPRRFDARFFLADSSILTGDPDDFSRASDELSHLQWIPMAKARSFNLPFITEVALAEVSEILANGGAVESVPFFDNSGPVPTFRRIS